MNKKFWLVSELFFPEETSTAYYITEIAKSISQFREVNVICGANSYEKQTNIKSSVSELPSNINVFRVKFFQFNKNILFLRTLRLIGTTIGLASRLLTKTKKGDEVWLVTNPAFLIPIAAILAKLIQFKLTILVHDVFPENLVPANILDSKSYRFIFMKKIFDKAYSSSSQIIVCGRDMEKLIKQKTNNNSKVKINVIENWADVETVYPIKKSENLIYKNLGLSKKIIFQFAGNIGRLQGLEQIMEIAEKCINPIIHFVIIGEGALKNKLKAIVNDKDLKNVTFLDSFNRDQQNMFLNACDVGIVSLYDNMLGLGVPSKSYNIMAAGKPILFLGNKNSEIALMVNEHKIGWRYDLSEQKKIIDFFNNFNKQSLIDLEKGIRKLAEKKYSKEIILSKYIALLN